MEKKLLDPEKNIINVSTKKSTKIYFFISKVILKKFGNLELHSLGRASKSVVHIAESLVRNKIAVITNIESYLTTLSDDKNPSGTRNELAFKVCLKTSE